VNSPRSRDNRAGQIRLLLARGVNLRKDLRASSIDDGNGIVDETLL
jgi:hypothetical protein